MDFRTRLDNQRHGDIQQKDSQLSLKLALPQNRSVVIVSTAGTFPDAMPERSERLGGFHRTGENH